MPPSYVHHRTWQDKKKAIMEERNQPEDVDDSSDSESSSVPATTLPGGRVTYWDKSSYRSRRPSYNTKLTSILDSTTRSRSTTRHSSSWSTSVSTGYLPDTVTVENRNLTGTKPVSAALTAALAALGGLVLVLLVLIAYFAYFRKRGWRSPSTLSGTDGEIQMVEGITNVGYNHHAIKSKKGDRLSIITECTEENDYEYEYVDSDKHGTTLVTDTVDDYEYIASDKNQTKDNISHISNESESYEYNDPSNLRPSTLPAIIVTEEETDYVDPDKAPFTKPDSTEDPQDHYQHMIESTLEQHFYADKSFADREDDAPSHHNEESEDSDDEPPEYAVIESPVTENVFHQDETTPE